MNQSLISSSFRNAVILFRWTILVGFVLLAGLPFVTGWLAQYPFFSTNRVWLSWIEWLGNYGLIVFLAGWIFFVGSCFASFLNVVAWRLPRKKSLMGQSHCPYCGATLSLRQNMPIIGWLEQQGRSKCCELPISPRYLIVEIILGTMFLLVGALEIGTGGETFPNWLIGHTDLVSTIDARLVVLSTGHLILICLLFTHCLFRFEGDAIPSSVFVVGIIAMIAVQGFLSYFRFQELQGESVASFANREMLFAAVSISLTIVLSLTVSTLLATFEKSTVLTATKSSWREILMAMLLIGFFVSPDSVLFVAVWYVFLSMVLVATRQFGDGTGWLAPSHRFLVATIIHLILWRVYSFENVPQKIVALLFST